MRSWSCNIVFSRLQNAGFLDAAHFIVINRCNHIFLLHILLCYILTSYHTCLRIIFWRSCATNSNMYIFSSPEPKAHWWAYSIPVEPASVSACVCVCVNTFRHEYLCNQLADWNEILFEASLGWGKGFSRFWSRWVKNSGFHGNR